MHRFNRSMFAVLALNLFAFGPAVYAESASPQTGTPALAPASSQLRAMTSHEVSALPQPAEAALSRLYELVPELKSYSVRHRQYQEDRLTGRAYWMIQLDKRPDGAVPPKHPFAVAHVTIDAKTNLLTAFHLYDPDWTPDRKLSSEEVKKQADRVLGVLLGERAKTYRPAGEPRPIPSKVVHKDGKEQVATGAMVRYDRVVNGIPLKSHGYTIEFFGDRLTSFHGEHAGDVDSVTFPDPSRAMTKEQAEAAYRKLLEMNLYYAERQPLSLTRFPQTPDTRPVLKYVPSYSGPIDAVTGEPADLWQAGQTVQPKTVPLQSKGQMLKVSSRKEAETLLKERFGMDVSALVFNEMREGGQPYPQRAFIHYTWMSQVDESRDHRPGPERKYVQMNVDAVTGTVISLHIQDGIKEHAQVKISSETAEAEANAFLQTYLDRQVSKLMLRQVSLSTEQGNIPDWVDTSGQIQPEAGIQPEYTLVYHELHQGVPIEDRTYFVRIDAETGRVLGFHLGAYAPKAELPDQSGAVSAEQAEQALVEYLDLELAYVWPEYMGQKAPSPQLVYIPDDEAAPGYVDAFTGKVEELRAVPLELDAKAK